MWPLVVMYVLLLPCVALFIRIKKTGEKRFVVSLKAWCTFLIVAASTVGMVTTPGDSRLAALLIVVGLLLGLAGDVAICFTLKGGMLLFGLGHCAYIVALCRISTHDLAAIPIFVFLYVLVLIFYRVSRLSLGAYTLPGLLYSALLIGMLSIAGTLPFSVLPAGAVLLVGALLFTASDMMLAWTIFNESVSVPMNSIINSQHLSLDAISLWCYFLGQSLFAVGVFLLR